MRMLQIEAEGDGLRRWFRSPLDAHASGCGADRRRCARDGSRPERPDRLPGDGRQAHPTVHREAGRHRRSAADAVHGQRRGARVLVAGRVADRLRARLRRSTSAIYTMTRRRRATSCSLTAARPAGHTRRTPRTERRSSSTGRCRTGTALWLMQSDGNGTPAADAQQAGRATDECRCDGSPVFSPDGKRIAFVRTITDLKTAAFVVDVGRHAACSQLTPWRLGVSAKLDWSPDGTRLLICEPSGRSGPGVASNVYTIRPDGTGLTQLTHETKAGVHDLADGFSPDGTRIIFAKTVDGGPFQVYVMNADGTGVKAAHQRRRRPLGELGTTCLTERDERFCSGSRQ